MTLRYYTVSTFIHKKNIKHIHNVKHTQTNCGMVMPNENVAASQTAWHHPLFGDVSSYSSFLLVIDSSVVHAMLVSGSYPGHDTNGPEKPKMITIAMSKRPSVIDQCLNFPPTFLIFMVCHPDHKTICSYISHNIPLI